MDSRSCHQSLSLGNCNATFTGFVHLAFVAPRHLVVNVRFVLSTRRQSKWQKARAKRNPLPTKVFFKFFHVFFVPSFLFFQVFFFSLSFTFNPFNHSHQGSQHGRLHETRRGSAHRHRPNRCTPTSHSRRKRSNLRLSQSTANSLKLDRPSL